MKRPNPPVEHTRFSGVVRHYHRSSAQAPRSWDDWVEGAAAKTHRVRNWPKIIGIIVSILALCGIITGLIVELG